MSIRPLNLPDDFPMLEQLLPAVFLDPHSPWQAEPDELDDVLGMLGFMRTFWKVLNLARRVSSRLRDTFLGFVWEIEHEAAGAILVDRIPHTTTWQIGIMGVLRPFQRRGIGTRLAAAVIDLVREMGGNKIIVEVHGENVAAQRLYERLHFETYDGVAEYEYTHTEPPPAHPMPDGYSLAPLPYFTWRDRYELAQRINPPPLQHYEPISETDFERPRIRYSLRRLWLWSRGVTETEVAVRTVLDGQIVARGGHAIRSRWGDMSEVALRVDPDHASVTACLLRQLMQDTQRLSRRRRIELVVPIWQQHIVNLAEETGFEHRASFYKLGLTL